MMTRPNFFIAGAPKCGTTALYEYLRRHPRIFMSAAKEPHWFSKDLPRHCTFDSLVNYEKLFRDATTHDLAVGEASPFYLSSQVAADNIRQYDPAAKIVAMLRNPIEAAYSYHSQLVYSSIEDEQDFRSAWRLQTARRQDKAIPKTCPEPLFLQYRAVFLLGEQVERLLSIFPRSQVKLIVFDDFTKNTKAIYEEVLAFLGVPSDGCEEFPRINENKQMRNASVGKFILHTPRTLSRCLGATKRLLGLNDLHVSPWLRKLNSRTVRRSPLGHPMKQELAEAFRDDIHKLSGLLGRDLSHWIDSVERVSQGKMAG